MDTVYVLVGKIGTGNLSTHAKKRLAKLNELNDSLANLETALSEAEKKDQAVWEKKVDDARKYLENYENDFQVFLDEEYADVEKKQEAKAEADRVAKEKADALANGTPPAGTPPAGTPPAGTPPAGTPPAGTPTPVKEEKSGIGFGTIIVGGIIAVATFGAINYFKNK